MNREITGKFKVINETKTFGASGFRKRETVVTTNEQYPQSILIEFVQDKCDLLDTYKVGQEVKISYNLRGKEWINPEGETKYFNSIQGWRIELLNQVDAMPSIEAPPILGKEEDGLPF